MGIEQKVRSLLCGLPAGILFQELDGVTVLPLTAVPFELEHIVLNWILALPQELHADALHFVDGVPHALTHYGWEAFVSWMLNCLQEAQQSPDFEHAVAGAALKSIPS